MPRAGPEKENWNEIFHYRYCLVAGFEMQAIQVGLASLKVNRSFTVQAWRVKRDIQVRCFQSDTRDYRSVSRRSSAFPSNDFDHLFGQTSVLMALQNKKRRPKKLYIQRRTSESQFTTKRKDEYVQMNVWLWLPRRKLKVTCQCAFGRNPQTSRYNGYTHHPYG